MLAPGACLLLAIPAVALAQDPAGVPAAPPVGGGEPAATAPAPPALVAAEVRRSGTRMDATVRYRLDPSAAGLEVLPFIEDMPRRLAECDLIVCRAGAVTVSELSVLPVNASTVLGKTTPPVALMVVAWLISIELA